MYQLHRCTFLGVFLLAVTVVHACYYDHLSGAGIARRAPLPAYTIHFRNVTRPKPKRIAIQNVRVFDGSRILSPSTVFINGEVIGLANMAVDEVVDGHSGVLLPGLIDAHLHPQNISHLELLTSYGITTAFDMNCFPPALCNSLRGQVGLTDLYSAGLLATSPNSTHSLIPGFPRGDLITQPSDASRFVADRVGNGSDYIKLIAERNGMTQPEHDAIVAESHRSGKQAMTHAADYHSYEMAVKSQSDIIQHLPIDIPINKDIIQSMIRQRQKSTPTLIALDTIVKALRPPNATYEVARQNAYNLYRAGIPILAGTDANTGGFGFVVPFGNSLHRELELLHDAGMPAVEVLRAATSRPAHFFGLNDRGVIAPGRRADLLLIAGDPLANISNTRNIRRVWTAGIEYVPVAHA